MSTDRRTHALALPGGSDLLASELERERAVALLRDGGAEGRLTPHELEERVERALGARTRGELTRVIEDLPDEAGAATPERAVRGDRGAVRRQLAIYAAVNLLLIVVWAISGAGYFWPLWPLLGWGLGLAKHHGHHRPARQRDPRRAGEWSASSTRSL